MEPLLVSLPTKRTPKNLGHESDTESGELASQNMELSRYIRVNLKTWKST